MKDMEILTLPEIEIIDLKLSYKKKEMKGAFFTNLNKWN